MTQVEDPSFGIHTYNFVIIPGRGLDRCCCLFESLWSQEMLRVLQQLDSVALQNLHKSRKEI